MACYSVGKSLYNDSGYDENQAITRSIEHPLRFKEKGNNQENEGNILIKHISNSCFVQDINLPRLSIQDSQCFVNVIQVSKSNLE